MDTPNYLIKVISHYQEEYGTPIPMRVLLSTVQNDTNNPFKPQDIHYVIISTLLDLEEKGYLMLSKYGWSTWVPNRRKE